MKGHFYKHVPPAAPSGCAPLKPSAPTWKKKIEKRNQNYNYTIKLGSFEKNDQQDELRMCHLIVNGDLRVSIAFIQ